MGNRNRQVLIAALPSGPLQASDFEVVETGVPTPGAGEVLCRTLAITIGAGQRAGLQGSASYAGAPQVGIVMGGSGVAEVVQSDDASLQPGDLVTGPTGWQEYSVHQPRHLTKVDGGIDPTHHLGLLGTNGLTAYFGLLDIGRPQPEETVVVSAASGSVGHIVGQLATLQGARAVGVAGSDEKCRLLVDELGFAAAVNRKADDFRDAFKAATPDGIDVYFDNTGGDILGAALRRMRPHGRIVCCGVVSQYDTTTPEPGPRGIPGLLVNNRVRMEGFLVFDYVDRYPEARTALRDWLTSGQLRAEQDVFEGLDSAPQAFVDLLAGGNVGTRVVRVAE